MGKFSGEPQAKGLREKITVTLDFSCTQYLEFVVTLSLKIFTMYNSPCLSVCFLFVLTSTEVTPVQ